MKLRLLVIDDDPDLLLILTDWLQAAGHEVRSAPDGEAGIAALGHTPVDLVLLDVDMPKMDGIQVLKLVSKRWPEVPVVMMTGHGSIRLAVEAMREGATDFVTKPFQHAQLEAAIAQAASRHRLKDEVTRLLGEVSHEIKNLLMPVVSGTDLLEGEISELFHRLPEITAAQAEERHHACSEIIEMLQRASRRLHERTKDIADYVKYCGMPVKFQPCRLAHTAESVMKSLRPMAEQKRLDLHAEGLNLLPTLVGDESRLFSLLYNLVHNAIPEVPAEGSVVIRGSVDEPAECIVLTVQDTGNGMPPEVRDHLFTGHSVSRKAGGTGLGTKIIKDAVELHGGRISVQSQPGQGTIFTIRLPLHPPAAAAGRAPVSL